MILASDKTETVLDLSYIKINGGYPLHGKTYIDKSKNAILQLMAASILLKNEILTLNNIPEITDVFIMKNILQEIGLNCTFINNTLKIGGYIKSSVIFQELASKIRASIVLLGPMLGTYGEAVLPLPGGDKIGNRPVDIHIECLTEFDIDFKIKNGIIYAKAKEFPLKGQNIFMRFPSVLGTGSLIMAAVLAKGNTKIENAACEPEIVDLAVMLNKMGAKISGAGTKIITITGVDSLHGESYEPIPDRIETGTILAAMAITGGFGIIEKCIPAHNTALISILKSIGIKITTSNDGYIQITQSKINKTIHATAMAYPGFPTDLQPVITCLATQCPGVSIITDTIYPNRFSHIAELQKLGAKIIQSGNQAIVTGKEPLMGGFIEGNDIRCASSLVCAGLAAQGTTKVSGLEHLLRGHANLLKKFQSLHADIKIAQQRSDFNV